VEVILLKDVDNVGLRGEVVNVSRGFMRNYLQPRSLAEAATPGRVAELERRDAERARHEARSVEQAREIAEALRKTVLRFEVQAGPRGTLFGSVTPTDVADELWRARRIRVDRRKIQLSGPIKRVGRYEIPIEVFQDVDVEVKTLVVPEGGDLPSDEELAAWEAEERAAAGGDGEAAAPVDEEAPAEAADERDLPDEVEAGEAAEAADGRPTVEDEEPAAVEDGEPAAVEDGERAEHLGRGQPGETP
jgi:large subunit ribosomal protein L9